MCPGDASLRVRDPGDGKKRQSVVTVEVLELQVEIVGSGADVVDEVSFSVPRGEVLGLVGESGSGKTTVGLALLGYARRGLRITGGQVLLEGRDILAMNDAELRNVRGGHVSYVPQDPATALNPALRVGSQLNEVLRAHGHSGSNSDRANRLLQLLTDVKLPATRALLRAYPHQLSGGQQQRVTIAMAFANRPRLIVMDEPTTGLDVTTQAHVLATIRDLCASHGVAAVYVSHDLAVVASIAQRVAVMYAGRIVEAGPANAVLSAPVHPYTRELIRAVPDISGRRVLRGIRGQAPEPGQRPLGCFFAPRCPVVMDRCRGAFPDRTVVGAGHEARCYRADEHRDTVLNGDSSPEPAGTLHETEILRVRDLVARHGPKEVLHHVDLRVPVRSCVALVGESGSGKTTLARCVVGLHADLSGEMTFRGAALSPGARARSPEVRRTIQYIFQNPYASLNPRRTVRQNIAQPLHRLSHMPRREVEGRVTETLEAVALRPEIADRYPHQLSGGQRQRAAIARALIVEPALLICDEVTSSLDVSVQAVIVDLLGQLQQERGLAMLFVTHNLALIRSIAQLVAVMSQGHVVEAGSVEEVLDHPHAEETRRLVADAPRFGTPRAAGSPK